jgi:pentatricopeptide repeat protein
VSVAPTDQTTTIVADAQKCLQAGKAMEAVALLQQASRAAPEDADVFHLLGAALTTAADFEGAIGAFENAVRLNVNLPKTWEALLDCYLRTDHLDAGIAFFGKMMEKNPGGAFGFYALGCLNAEAGYLDKAAQYLEPAVAAIPHVLGLKYWLGCVMLAAGRYARARELFQQCLALKGTPQEQRECLGLEKEAVMLAHIRPALHGVTGARNVHVDTTQPRDTWEAEAIAAIQAQLQGFQPGPLAAVFFHVDAGDRHPYLTADTAVDYKTTLMHACQAAQRARPDTTPIILTNENSALGELGDLARCIRLPIPPDQMMHSRVRANRALVMSGIITSPVLFLDTDILLNRDFTSTFDGSFDVGLTYRNKPSWAAMPINEGVILGAGGASPALARFYGDILNIYDWLAQEPLVRERYGLDIRNWRGGQLSLGALIDWAVPPNGPSEISRNGVRYKLLPSRDFNYAVKPGDHHAFLATKWAVHFKGAAAKPLMANYSQHKRA